MRNAELADCLNLVIGYCDSIADRIERYDITEESVCEADNHLDLLLMPIFQIGELVGSQSYYDLLQESHPHDIWHQAYGLRNRIAHGYAKLAPQVIWDTATISIPELRQVCVDLLRKIDGSQD